jgi:hypothetical protein
MLYPNEIIDKSHLLYSHGIEYLNLHHENQNLEKE